MSDKALAVVPSSPSFELTAYEPSSISEGVNLAGLLFKSGLLGKHLQKPEAVFAIIVAGRELGLTAMQALRSLALIEGKISQYSDLTIGLVKRHRACEYFQLIESSGTIATYETKRVGEPHPTRMSFTIEQARAAQLVGKDNWKKYPDAMLRARAGSALARAVYPDVAGGIYDPDEITSTATVGHSQPAPKLDMSPAPAPAPTIEAEISEPAHDEKTGEVAPPANLDPIEIVQADFELAIDGARDLKMLSAVGKQAKKAITVERYGDAAATALAAISVKYEAKRAALKATEEPGAAQ